MWGDLTMEQKASVMRMAVKQGITDLNEIKDMYDSVILSSSSASFDTPTTFADGGNLFEEDSQLNTPIRDYSWGILPQSEITYTDYSSGRRLQQGDKVMMDENGNVVTSDRPNAILDYMVFTGQEPLIIKDLPPITVMVDKSGNTVNTVGGNYDDYIDRIANVPTANNSQLNSVLENQYYFDMQPSHHFPSIEDEVLAKYDKDWRKRYAAEIIYDELRGKGLNREEIVNSIEDDEMFKEVASNYVIDQAIYSDIDKLRSLYNNDDLLIPILANGYIESNRFNTTKQVGGTATGYYQMEPPLRRKFEEWKKKNSSPEETPFEAETKFVMSLFNDDSDYAKSELATPYSRALAASGNDSTKIDYNKYRLAGHEYYKGYTTEQAYEDLNSGDLIKATNAVTRLLERPGKPHNKRREMAAKLLFRDLQRRENSKK